MFFVFCSGEDRHKYGKQRMWGAVGWGTMSIMSGLCVDWFSKGQDDKNYAPGFMIALICFVLDIYVLSKIEVSTYLLISHCSLIVRLCTKKKDISNRI